MALGKDKFFIPLEIKRNTTCWGVWLLYMSSSQPGYSLELPGKFKIPMARPHLKPIKSESPKGKGAWVRVFVKVSQLFFMCTKCGDPLLYLCIVLSLSLPFAQVELKNKNKNSQQFSACN